MKFNVEIFFRIQIGISTGYFDDRFYIMVPFACITFYK